MPTLTSISISPPNPFVLISQTKQFTAVAHFSDAADLDITTDPTTTWASATTSVATISNLNGSRGLSTALTISGSSIISATYGGQTGTAILRVGEAEYTRIYEQLVDGVKSFETSLTAAHNPVIHLTTPNLSMFSGGVTLQNFNGVSASIPIGWTLAGGHPENFSETFIANEEQQDGYWVQQNIDGYATISFNSSQRNLGVVSSIAIDQNGNQLTSGGNPVLVQTGGEAYVFTTDSTIVRGSFLWYDVNGKVKAIAFSPSSPTPIIGYALESYANSTFDNMVLMRIQICGG